MPRRTDTPRHTKALMWQSWTTGGKGSALARGRFKPTTYQSKSTTLATRPRGLTQSFSMPLALYTLLNINSGGDNLILNRLDRMSCCHWQGTEQGLKPLGSMNANKRIVHVLKPTQSRLCDEFLHIQPNKRSERLVCWSKGWYCWVGTHGEVETLILRDFVMVLIISEKKIALMTDIVIFIVWERGATPSEPVVHGPLRTIDSI